MVATIYIWPFIKQKVAKIADFLSFYIFYLLEPILYILCIYKKDIGDSSPWRSRCDPQRSRIPSLPDFVHPNFRDGN